MANALYGKGRQKFLEGSIAWLTDDIRAILIDTALYTVQIDVHEFLSDIPAGARVAVSDALAGKSSTLGVADAADKTFLAVTGASVEALVLYKHTGTEGTSPLIAWLDNVTGIPFTPSGADEQVVWSDGANKIFKL
jgi:hypothetical protein